MDSDFDCQVNGKPCRHCQFHILQLRQNGVPRDGLEYREGTYPVVFDCIFIYRYDDEPEAYVKRVQEAVSETLHRRFKQIVPVYGDFRMHTFSSPEGPKDHPCICISLLVDFPHYVKVDKELFADLFEYWTPSLSDWEIKTCTATDHLSISRLRWFLERAGIPHDPECVENALLPLLDLVQAWYY
ncbi:hypothetical protein BJX76DRAFT_362831 [Aspergillus varians]